MTIFHSPTTKGFYRPEFHGENIPDDAIEITEEEHAAMLAAGHTEPATRESVERTRLAAYADPQTGSDRLFNEASRMQMMGESGWEAVRDAAVARYNEIKAAFPWPE